MGAWALRIGCAFSEQAPPGVGRSEEAALGLICELLGQCAPQSRGIAAVQGSGCSRPAQGVRQARQFDRLNANGLHGCRAMDQPLGAVMVFSFWYPSADSALVSQGTQ